MELCWRMTVGMERTIEQGDRVGATGAGRPQGSPLPCLRSGLPGSSIVGAMACPRPGWGGRPLVERESPKYRIRQQSPRPYTGIRYLGEFLNELVGTCAYSAAG